MDDCIFCKIVKGQAPAYVIWEDEKHMAFLSPWGNTDGFTVVITKDHYSSYVFDLPETVMLDLVKAAKAVAKQIDEKFDDVGRCGLIFEGFGVNHIHAKIFPMHGTGSMKEWKEMFSDKNHFFETYEGYISTHDMKERHSEEKLEQVWSKLKK